MKLEQAFARLERFKGAGVTVTCPHRSCGRRFRLAGRPRRYQEVTCPYCKRVVNE